MRFCDNCKVKVNDVSQYCPLCGNFLEHEIQDPQNDYIQSRVQYPSLKVEGKTKHYFQKRFFWFLLLIFVVCVAVNVLTFDGVFWTGYVLFGLIMVYYVVSSSVFRARRLYSLIGLTAIITSICVFGMDVTHSLTTTRSLADVSVSVEFIIPAIALGASILADVMIMSNKSKYKYYFVSLIGTTTIGVLIQLVVWIAKLNFAHDWFMFAVFFFSIANFILMTLIYWRTFKQEMLRKFNI